MSIYLIIGICTFILIIIAVSYFLSNKVLHPKKVCLNKSMHIESKYGRIIKKEYDKLNKDNVVIKSKEGYNLDATIIYRDGLDKNNIIKDKEKIIVFAHGYEYNRLGSVKYFNMFIKRKFNIVIYDHRNSGSSGGNTTTMGKKEKYDLKAILEETRKIFGNNSIVGIHGESMGASTALLSLEIDDKIDFIISDCAYSNLVEELSYQIKQQYSLPSFPFIHIASIITKLKEGYKYDEIIPIETIKKYGLNTPILFVHGAKDNFTPCIMTKQMYKERLQSVDKSVCTMIYIGENSDHAQTYWDNKEDYDDAVGEFFKEAGIEAIVCR